MKRRNSQAGNGSVGIVICVMGASIAWFVCLFVWNWIYETKEARSGIVVSTGMRPYKKYIPRGYFDPGYYWSSCTGFLVKSCELDHEHSRS